MTDIAKIYEAGLLGHHVANTAYPLTPNSFREWAVTDPKRMETLAAENWAQAESFGLYLHIPFCRTRCRFCEYTVLEPPKDAAEVARLHEEYTALLIREMALWSPYLHGKRGIGLDIGGGTPLILSVPLLQRITEAAETNFDLDGDMLRSIETTPEIAAKDPEKLAAVRAFGFRRISMGIQTVSPRLLEELGRSGSEGICSKAVRNIRNAGFELLNVDVMYGFLHQSDADLEATLRYAMDLGADQITLYRNRYKGTRIEEEAGGVSLYQAMRQYRLAFRMLSENGWTGNPGRTTFSRVPGGGGMSDYLQHRMTDMMPYLGLGLGAQSFGPRYLSYNEGAASKKLARYREKLEAGLLPVQDFYDLPEEECMAKALAVSFYSGAVDLRRFRERFGRDLKAVCPDAVDFVLEHHLMEEKDGVLVLTGRGADYVNGIIPLFYTERSKAELIRMVENRKEPENEEEKKFLSAYSIEKFPRPSVATDIVAMTIRGEETGNYRLPERRHLSVLLIRRGEHPYLNRWALPGGFLRPGETAEHCAQRELFEEAGLSTDALLPLGCFSDPGRDPRGWILSSAFLSVVGKGGHALEYGDDALDARWFDLSFTVQAGTLSIELTNGDIRLQARLKTLKRAYAPPAFAIEQSDLAFDHAKILATALSAVQADAGARSLMFAFLPAEFTIAELQDVYELLTGRPVIGPNFRRKVQSYLRATGRRTEGDGHRPAQIFTKNNEIEEEE